MDWLDGYSLGISCEWQQQNMQIHFCSLLEICNKSLEKVGGSHTYYILQHAQLAVMGICNDFFLVMGSYTFHNVSEPTTEECEQYAIQGHFMLFSSMIIKTTIQGLKASISIPWFVDFLWTYLRYPV